MTTKLFAPRFRSELISRSRLIERLNRGQHRKLTLVVAPAGFGKTVLLSDWARQLEKPVAWLSLDTYDNDPTRFCSYLTAAVQSVRDDCEQPRPTVDSMSQSAGIEQRVTELINDLIATGKQIAIVLDDYHLIETPLIHKAVEFLIDHLPPHVRLVIASRSDRSLPAGRLRGNDQLAEVTAADLRFTPSETSTFLHAATDVALSKNDIASMMEKVEGWAVGLRLASLVLQGKDDINRVTEAFSGGHRYVDDYLTEEVFRRLPEDIQDFLLQTCILDRLSASLCSAVTQRSDAGTLLEWLDTSNLFLTPLDDHQRWYRYHHIFQDFLHTQLRRRDQELESRLHRRAYRWFHDEERYEKAIKHALAAHDYECAASLIDQNAESVLKRGEVFTLKSWLDALPDEQVRNNPRLGLLHAWVLILTGNLDAVEPRVWTIERHLRKDPGLATDETPASSASSVGPTSRERAADVSKTNADAFGEMAAIRGTIARLVGNKDQAITFCQEALDLLSEDNLVWRSISLLNLGAAHSLFSDVKRARQAFRKARSLSRTSGDKLIAFSAVRRIARLQHIQGELHEAHTTYLNALQSVSEGNMLSMLGTGYAHIGLGEIYYEWNELDAAADYLAKGLQQGKECGTIGMLVLSYRNQARLAQARGDTEEALRRIEKAQQLAQRHQYEVAQVDVWETRLRIAHGNLDAAERWIRQCDPPVSAPTSYLQEFKQITLARAYIALDKPGEAIPLLQRIRSTAQQVNRLSSVIETLILEAIAYRLQGGLEESCSVLGSAMEKAKPEKYRRMFIDEGRTMEAILNDLLARQDLSSAPKGRGLTSYASALLEAVRAETGSSAKNGRSDASPQSVDLSDRELDVLRLIAKGLKNQDIADRLYIATSTVKWHNKNLFSKLEVENRTQAAERARRLNLV